MAIEAPSIPTGTSDSATLVGRLNAREPGAWERLTALYGPLVYRWARNANLQDSDAADIMQEVFRSVAEGVARFRKDRPQDTFRGWLWGITRHKILTEFRRRQSQPAITGEHSLDSHALDLPEAPTADATDDVSTVARRALDLIRGDFQEATWQAFEQTVMHGRSPADVAADLGIAVGSVYTAKCRVAARLRQEMGDLLDQ